MAEVNVLQTLIQLRRGTTEQWEAVKDLYIPKVGEPCVTLDGEFKGQIKVGDGVSTWGQLNYAGVCQNLTSDGKAIKIVNGIITLDGVNEATPGQTFKINEAGDGLEWFVPASESELDDYVTKQDLEEGNVPIHIANSEEIGGVKGSDEMNGISVDENGDMEVNGITVDKLNNAEGTRLILNGGSASVNV